MTPNYDKETLDLRKHGPKKNEEISVCSNGLLCVISLHDKGFWQADVYDKEAEHYSPNWFCTGKNGDDAGAVISRASREFPGIDFMFAKAECPCCDAQVTINGTELTCDECGAVFDA